MITTHEVILKPMFPIADLYHYSRRAPNGFARPEQHPTSDKAPLGTAERHRRLLQELRYRSNDPRVKGPVWVYARRAIGQHCSRELQQPLLVAPSLYQACVSRRALSTINDRHDTLQPQGHACRCSVFTVSSIATIISHRCFNQALPLFRT